MQLSEDQIIKLAPDAASVKAGKGIRAPAAKWVLRGASDRALWGHCQGSGKNLIRRRSICRISLSNVRALAISFLCKHSLGLLFLHASRPDLFMIGEEPDWVKGMVGETGREKQRRRRKKRINPWMPRRKRRGRRLATRKC